MVKVIKQPMKIEAAGSGGKIIEEYAGRVRTGTEELSVARMKSPGGWEEPGQRPEFTEYTLVLKGCLHVETQEKRYRVRAGEAIICHPGEWIRYSTPEAEGAEYIAICLPAFSADTVHRDESN